MEMELNSTNSSIELAENGKNLKTILNNQKKLIAAIEQGDGKTVEWLLENAEFATDEDDPENEENDLSMVKQNGNSILHLAVMYGHASIVEILMRDGRISPNLKNDKGQTPLHITHNSYNSKGNGQYNKEDHKSVLNTFLTFLTESNKDAVLDAQDENGCTPLHLAVQQKCTHCIQQLLMKGGALNIKSKLTNLPFVTPTIFHQDPWAGNLIERLNKDISCEQCSLDDEEHFPEGEDARFKVSFNFSGIVAKSTVDKLQPDRELEFLETFLSANPDTQKQVFNHPLVTSFVFMKWERVRRIFIASLILHIALAIVYTSYVMTVFLINCPYRPGNTSVAAENVTLVSRLIRITPGNKPCDSGLGFIGSSIVLLITTGILALLEIVKFLQNMPLYRNTWRNISQIAMIVCMFITVWPIKWTADERPFNWQYSSSAYGIFHVWATLMINMGRFPRLGIYVEMFGKVLQNFGYFMTAYIFLLIAFSISFCVIFPDYPPFETIPRAILKVITMMSGEVDYGDFFYGEHTKKEKQTGDFIFTESESTDLIHPVTGHLLYGAFVILVTIVLTNLLIGLAVDDIKGLQQNAEFTKTTKEVANIAYLESLIFWNKLPDWKLVRCLRRSIFLGRLDSSQNKIRWFIIDLLKWLRQKIFTLSLRRYSGSENANESRRPSNKVLPKYSFGIFWDDCKSPRCFPEDAYLRSVEIIYKVKRGAKNPYKFQNLCSKCQSSYASDGSIAEF